MNTSRVVTFFTHEFGPDMTSRSVLKHLANDHKVCTEARNTHVELFCILFTPLISKSDSLVFVSPLHVDICLRIESFCKVIFLDLLESLHILISHCMTV